MNIETVSSQMGESSLKIIELMRSNVPNMKLSDTDKIIVYDYLCAWEEWLKMSGIMLGHLNKWYFFLLIPWVVYLEIKTSLYARRMNKAQKRFLQVTMGESK